jgi:excisionase family DNA binding protein
LLAVANQQGLAMQTPKERDVSDDIPFRQRPSCTMREACRATGLSRTTLYERIATEELKTKTVGRRRLVNVASLLKLVGDDTDPENQRTHPG